MGNFTGNNLKGHWKLSIKSRGWSRGLNPFPFAIVPAHYFWQLVSKAGRKVSGSYLFLYMRYTSHRAEGGWRKVIFMGGGQNCRNPNQRTRFSVTTGSADRNFCITRWRLTALNSLIHLNMTCGETPSISGLLMRYSRSTNAIYATCFCHESRPLVLTTVF